VCIGLVTSVAVCTPAVSEWGRRFRYCQFPRSGESSIRVLRSPLCNKNCGGTVVVAIFKIKDGRLALATGKDHSSRLSRCSSVNQPPSTLSRPLPLAEAKTPAPSWHFWLRCQTAWKPLGIVTKSGRCFPLQSSRNERAAVSAASIKRHLNAPPKKRYKSNEADQKPRKPFHEGNPMSFSYVSHPVSLGGG
jgi:hypothetical protein